MFSGFSRRQVLKMIGSFVAGAATVGSMSLIGKWLVGAAQAQVRGISVYKGIDIVIDLDNITQPGGIALSIGGKQIDLVQNKRSGRYATGRLPFEDFASPQELAKELINLGAVPRTEFIQ